MKRWLVMGLVLATMVSFVCRTAAAETELVVAGYGGVFEKIFKDYLAPAFEKKHNVKIVFISGNSTETLARAQAQKDSPQMDVAFIDDGPTYQGAALGLWEPIDIQIVTNMNDLYDIARHKGDLGVDMGVIATGLMYNKEIFEQKGWAPPTSWADLGKKEYAGHMIMPPMQNGYGLLTVLMLAKMNGGSESNINPGFDALKRIKQNFLVFEPQPGKHSELFQSKQAWVGVWGSSRMYALAETGFPVVFVYPKEGSPAVAMSLVVIKGTKQKPIANELINYMLGKEAQTVWAEHFKTGPYNKTVVLKPEIANKVPYGREQIDKLYKADWETINKVRPEWTERWNKEVEN